jgi:hypothetical protein
MTINGFPISTKTEKIAIGRRYADKSLNCNCDHRKAKKSIIKKSLSGLILLMISTLYGTAASESHANNAPISRENQIISIAAAQSIHHHIAKMSKNS